MTHTHALVFDWNCTLLDDFQAMHDCMNIIMDKVGRAAITADYFRTHYNVPFEKLYASFGFTADEIDMLVNLDRHIFHHHYEPMADRALLRDGAQEIVERAAARGVETLILSNHIVGPIRTQLTRLGIHDRFADVLAYASHDVQFRDMTKGDKLRLYREKRHVRPEDTIIVGDSVEEIDIAREQGLISVALTGGCVSEARLAAAQPDYMIHSLHDLAPILQERGFPS
ncbi:MAG: HAD family hydrolase [Bdellovibrionales bacterium]